MVSAPLCVCMLRSSIFLAPVRLRFLEAPDCCCRSILRASHNSLLCCWSAVSFPRPTRLALVSLGRFALVSCFAVCVSTNSLGCVRLWDLLCCCSSFLPTKNAERRRHGRLQSFNQSSAPGSVHCVRRPRSCKPPPCVRRPQCNIQSHVCISCSSVVVQSVASQRTQAL